MRQQVVGYRMSTTIDPADLRALAVDVLRLLPDRRDPEQFHVAKSEIAGALRRLAKAAERRAA
jgi:hypothetical protein